VDKVAALKSDVVSTPFHNIHRRGADSRQGALLLEAGTLLRAPEVAVAASAGMARVRVSSQPAVMVVSTGDELVEPGDPIADYQIRRSNAYAVVATLRRRGFVRVGDDHVPDDDAVMLERLSLHLDTHDLLVLSGGVSMGKFDLVPKVLSKLGVEEVFHTIAQRPGKPMWFGVGPHGQAVFGLPGNPVSTLVCLARYVIPAISAAMGTRHETPERLALMAPVTFHAPLTYFLPVSIEHDDWGRSWANPRPTNGSGDFLSLAGTDGFVELPPGPNTYPKGFVSSVYRW
jgi:molybdopterin molybdotransferase